MSKAAISGHAISKFVVPRREWMPRRRVNNVRFGSRNKHMPLVKARMGASCRFYTVDKGLAGGDSGEPPTYIGMCHIYCDSVESFQVSFGPHAEEIMADIPNYTDLTPILQISEVVVGQQ